MVKVQRVTADHAGLIDPASRDWENAISGDFPLQPTPLTSQTSMYVQAKWKDVPYGGPLNVSVSALHNGDAIYFRLSWQDDTADDGIGNTDQFVDAAAVLFPLKDDAPLLSMGSPQQPVNAWYWRPDLEAPYSTAAKGTGTTRRTVDPDLHAGGGYADGRWSMVVGRKLKSLGKEYVSLEPGMTAKVAFAVWQGSNQERGGLKAASQEWQPLEIEA
jgi:DMSO reductase family type II enzyme heme b subunit